MTDHLTSMPGKDGLDYELLERYWLNETTPQESALVHAWFSRNPERHEWYKQLRASIKAGNWTPLSKAEVDQAIVTTLRATGLPLDAQATPAVFAPSSNRVPNPAASPSRQTPRMVAAPSLPMPSGGALRRWITPAVASVVLGCAMFFLTLPKKVDSQGWIYATSNGERARVVLPDGSVVELNVGSKLEVSPEYDRGERKVTLSGEALFSVNARSNAPFTVIAGPSHTRVLGTSFAVRRYATDSVATVAVRDGKVAVNSVVLTASQQVHVGDHGVSSVYAAHTERFQFVDGILSFNSVPLGSTIDDLNRWYDADIRLGDASLANQRVTGECAKGSISDLVELLEGTFNVRVERNGRTLILYPR